MDPAHGGSVGPARAWLILLAIIISLPAAACGPKPREYELNGQVLAVDQARLQITIKHGDIQGYMPGMTMAFEVRSGKLLEERVPGDLVRATLVVSDRDAYLRTLERTGHAPVTEPITNPSPRLLMPGELAADAALIDQTGTSTRLADLRGNVIAVTFMYTRCPLPNFCPLMDRHFKAVQDRVNADPQLKGQVRLLSVTLDPAYDTPAVLAKHAALLGADPAVWRFLTGPKEEVRRFGGQFGLSTPGGGQDETEIVHNLRTVVIDRQGRLAATLNGNEWTPPQLVDALRKAY